MIRAYKYQALIKSSVSICFLAFVTGGFVVDAKADSHHDLTGMSLEALLNVSVTSVAKREQTIKSSPAAIFVISQEDIRRSTARSVAELLRMVPGIHVARLDGSRYAISSRGLNGLFADKLLVLIDGRNVYTPVFSGVYWDAQDPMLEDIDRIEVIRGPGAALWGTNAVNGVINIITKKSSDTQGGFASGGGGNKEQGFGAVRYGFKLGDSSTARVYGKVLGRDRLRAEDGGDNYDALVSGQEGFRIDAVDGANQITIQGDVQHGRGEIQANYISLDQLDVQSIRKNSSFGGENLLGRIVHHFDDSSELQAQLYFDRTDRNDITARQNVETYDFDSQYRTRLSSSNEITLGASYRFVEDAIYGNQVLSFEPISKNIRTPGAFIQDEIELLPSELKFTLGTKYEHNEFVGSVWQPDARLMWQPNERNSFWTAFSRAARTPALADNGIRLPASVVPGELPAVVTIIGNSHVGSEILNAYQLGYRFDYSNSLTFDVATFYDRYTDIITLEAGEPSLDASGRYAIVPLSTSNLGKQDIYGGEFVVTWQALPQLRLQSWYAYQHITYSLSSASNDQNLQTIGGQNPRNQAALRASTSLTDSVELDGMLRYVGALNSIQIDDYVEFNVRLGWHISKDLELSLNGTDLLHANHAEGSSQYVNIVSARPERGVYGLIRYAF